jgi:hypothetical protein
MLFALKLDHIFGKASLARHLPFDTPRRAVRTSLGQRIAFETNCQVARKRIDKFMFDLQIDSQDAGLNAGFVKTVLTYPARRIQRGPSSQQLRLTAFPDTVHQDRCVATQIPTARSNRIKRDSHDFKAWLSLFSAYGCRLLVRKQGSS